MSTLANLVRWEWFKLSRRWMPWILVAILVLFTQLVLWASVNGYQSAAKATGPTINLNGNPSGPFRQGITLDCSQPNPSVPPGLPAGFGAGLIQQACAQWQSAHQAELQALRNSFSLPGALTTAVGVTERLGVFLIAILAASVIGSEYGWGTLRAALAQGPGRWRFLSAKLILLALLTLAAFVVVMVFAAATCIVASNLAGKGVATTATWGDVASNVGRMSVALLLYLAMATFITVLSGSSAAGTAITLAYQFVETIAVALLTNLLDWFHNVADYLPAHNVDAWVQGGSSVGRGVLSGVTSGLPSPTHGLIVLLCYTFAFLGIAFWIFQRRDVRGPSGG